MCPFRVAHGHGCRRPDNHRSLRPDRHGPRRRHDHAVKRNGPSLFSWVAGVQRARRATYRVGRTSTATRGQTATRDDLSTSPPPVPRCPGAARITCKTAPFRPHIDALASQAVMPACRPPSLRSCSDQGGLGPCTRLADEIQPTLETARSQRNGSLSDAPNDSAGGIEWSGSEKGRGASKATFLRRRGAGCFPVPGFSM